jgi:hypothetical protein
MFMAGPAQTPLPASSITVMHLDEKEPDTMPVSW